MENLINVAEILRGCPQGMELYSPLYNNLYFDKIIDCEHYPIKCYTLTNEKKYLCLFSKYGEITVSTETAKCVIFPKSGINWEGFQKPFKDGDVIFGNNKNMRTQESQEQKEQRVKSIIESYKIINKDYVLIQIHDEVILCFPNKESALQSLKKDIMYNKRKDEDEMVNFYLWIYFRINEGQRMFDYNGENKMEVCGNEEVICK